MSNAYSTLAEVKAYSGQTSTVDAQITALIAPAAAIIDLYCNRDFILHTGVTEVRHGNGNYKIMPKFGPIISVASVSVDGVAVPASANPLAYGFVADADLIYIRNSSNACPFARGILNVSFVYTAGYSVVPDDIKQASIDLILYKLAKAGRMDKESETLAGQTVTFSQKDFPASLKNTLNQYRRWMI